MSAAIRLLKNRVRAQCVARHWWVRGVGLVVFAVMLFGCDRWAHQAVASTNALVGSWSLAEVDEAPPSRVNIKAWRLTIRENGTWSYEGEMQGSWTGMKLSGEGTWQLLAPAQIQYTAGSNSGTLSFKADHRSLTLSPDPVIAKPGGVGPSVTRYKRTE